MVSCGSEMPTSDGPQAFPYKSSLFILKEWCWGHTITSMQETRVQPLGRVDPLQKEMATHSSILAQRTPWTEEPGGLVFIGLQRVGHN